MLSNKLSQSQHLRTTPIYYLMFFVDQASGNNMTLCLDSPKWNQGVVRAVFSSGAQGSHPSSCRLPLNSMSCSQSTEVPVAWLAGCQGPALSRLRDGHLPPHLTLPSSKPAMDTLPLVQSSSYFKSLGLFLSLTSRSRFKRPYDQVKTIQSPQFKVNLFGTLLISAKFLHLGECLKSQEKAGVYTPEARSLGGHLRILPITKCFSFPD